MGGLCPQWQLAEKRSNFQRCGILSLGLQILLIPLPLGPSNLQYQKGSRFNFPQEKQFLWHFWLKFLLPLHFLFLKLFRVIHTAIFHSRAACTLAVKEQLFQEFNNNKWKVPKLKKKKNDTDCLNASVEAMKSTKKSASNWKWTQLSGDEIQFIGNSLERGKKLWGWSLHTKKISWSLMILTLKHRQLLLTSRVLGKEYHLA